MVLKCFFEPLKLIFFQQSYDIFRNKCYQLKENGISTIVTRVTGTGYTHEETPLNNAIFKISDTSGIFSCFLKKSRKIYLIIKFSKDYIKPPNEHNSIFIKTNFVETIQKEGKCAEVYFVTFLIKLLFRLKNNFH